MTSYVKLRRSLDKLLATLPLCGTRRPAAELLGNCCLGFNYNKHGESTTGSPQATTPAATTLVAGVRIGGPFDSISASGPAGGQLATAGGGREAPKESDFLGQGGFTASQAIDPDQRPSL